MERPLPGLPFLCWLIQERTLFPVSVFAVKFELTSSFPVQVSVGFHLIGGYYMMDKKGTDAESAMVPCA